MFWVRSQAFKPYVQASSGWDEDEERRLHERRFAGQDYRIIVLGGTDIGVMSTAVASECLSLYQLFILPEHQGKGIGRLCVQTVLEEAARLGLPVRLRVLRTNPRAVAFYERVGFRPCGTTSTHTLMEYATPKP